MYLQWLSTMIPLQWLYAVPPIGRLHVMKFLLLFCTLVVSLVMLPSTAPCFALFPYKFWSFAALDNTWSRFFLPSRSSILNLVYLCYFRSKISDFGSYSSPLSHPSNATGLTQFSSKSYAQFLTMLQLWTVSVEKTCTACHVSLFLHSTLKFIERKL